MPDGAARRGAARRGEFIQVANLDPSGGFTTVARDLGVTWSPPIRPSLGWWSRGPLSGTLAGGKWIGRVRWIEPARSAVSALCRRRGQKPSANLASSLI